MNASIKNNHKEIPGNPSTPKENKFRLNDRSDNLPLRVLSESDWKFWKSQGYVVIKKAISKSHKLYHSDSVEYVNENLNLIPYFLWANRGENEMKVWINEIMNI